MSHEPLSEDELEAVRASISSGVLRLKGSSEEKAVWRLIATIEDLHIQLEEERRPRLRKEARERFSALYRKVHEDIQIISSYYNKSVSSTADALDLSVIREKAALIIEAVNEAEEARKRIKELEEEP